MSEQLKKVKTRIVHKHDIAENWEQAVNFVPKQGEIIVYDDRTLKEKDGEPGKYETAELVSTAVKYKVGDGVTPVNDLPFMSPVYQGNAAGSAVTGTNNIARSSNSYAEGTENITGCSGFSILKIEPAGSELSTDNTMTLFLDSIEGLAVGDRCSIRLGGNITDFASIIELDSKSSWIKIDLYPAEFTSAQIAKTTAGGGTSPAQFWVNEKQNIGTQIFDAAQHAEGCATAALMYAAHAEGYATIAAGRYSHAEGTETLSAYAAHAEGRKSKATGRQAHAEGYNTLASGEDAHSEGIDTKATGGFSHAEGYGSESSGPKAHAEGYQTEATAEAAHSEGYKTEAKELAAHAEGLFAVASGQVSHAEGKETAATGDGSHAEGISSIAAGRASHAEGSAYTVPGTGTRYVSTAEGDSAHAEGQGGLAQGIASHVEGRMCIAKGQLSHSEGRETVSDGTGSHSEGVFTQAVGRASHAEGESTIADGDFSHAEGHSTHASGTYAHAEGFESVSNTFAAHAEGRWNHAEGVASHAEGSSTYAVSDAAHAEGSWTRASGVASHAEGSSYDGIDTTASGKASHAEGQGTTASGDGSHAEGRNSKAGGALSHAEGNSTETASEASHAEGKNTKATKIAAHAEGQGTQATGNYAHAEGTGSKATATGAHAEGSWTNATGDYSHTEGASTYATGKNSHAEGKGTYASGEDQHVQGRYNIIDSSKAHIVGNGTSTSDRKNIHTLDWNGLAWYAGGLRVGGDDGTGAVHRANIEVPHGGLYAGFVHSNEGFSNGDGRKLLSDNYIASGRVSAAGKSWDTFLVNSSILTAETPYVQLGARGRTKEVTFNTYRYWEDPIYGEDGIIYSEKRTVMDEATLDAAPSAVIAPCGIYEADIPEWNGGTGFIGDYGGPYRDVVQTADGKTLSDFELPRYCSPSSKLLTRDEVENSFVKGLQDEDKVALNVGSTSQPVYFNNGVPKAVTDINANKINGKTSTDIFESDKITCKKATKASTIKAVDGSNTESSLSIKILTQAQYDAITNKDATVLYLIKD